jgi:Chaperone of endosialidase
MRRIAVACLLLSSVFWPASTAFAQTLGTFRWQLQPYCNVIAVTVVQQGSQYQLNGTDDQCGASQQAGVTGLAFLNPDGTVGFGLNIVTAPGGAAVHVDASMTISTLGGTWRDSAGATGTFTFTPGAGTGGSPRPAPLLAGTVTDVTAGTGLTGGGTGAVSLAVDFAAAQQRVTGTCPAGQLMTAVNQNGTVTCQSAPAGSGGDITAVVAGTGLTGGAATGDATLAVAFGGPGSVAQAARSDHTHGLGTESTAIGAGALASDLGYGNTAVGFEALRDNVNGPENTAVGHLALAFNTDGQGNTAVGEAALLNSAIGSDNVAVGRYALYDNTTASENVGIGRDALRWVTTDGGNTAIGSWALGDLTYGASNIALGQNAGRNLYDGAGNIYIGSTGATSENDTTRIGSGATRAFVAGIRGVTTGVNDAVQVVVDSDGQLGTVSSSARTKDDIRDLGSATAGLLQRLRPVQFRYKAPFANGERPLQYGLIAEEVEAVAPELVAYNARGDVETVKYHVLPSLLVAEVQRLERERASLSEQVREQAAALSALRAIVDELRARPR